MAIVEHSPKIQTEYVERKTCRSCNSQAMWDILSLGDQHIVSFDKSDKLPPKIPLTLCLCGNCRLVQLRHTTRPDLLYNENYGYRSGINEMMRKELLDVTTNIEDVIPLKERDIVLDIGANDGTLLVGYKNKDLRKVGFDPSKNMIGHFMDTMFNSQSKNYHIIPDFFSSWPFLKSYHGEKAKAITAVAMFYDLDNPNRFLQDVKKVLDKDGVFVIQQNYLAGMLKQRAFDNICHEHLEYYSLSSMIPLLKRNELEVFDVEERKINGGSFRTYIRHLGSNVNRDGGEQRVWEMLDNELNMGLLDKEVYEKFGQDVIENGNQLKSFIENEVKDGKKIYVYGASTRGSTLLQFYGIDSSLITGAAERNSEKWGKLYGSTGIPIVSEDEARAKAGYFLCLPWFFKDNFIKREQVFLDRGGKLIIPLPRMEVISK